MTACSSSGEHAFFAGSNSQPVTHLCSPMVLRRVRGAEDRADATAHRMPCARRPAAILQREFWRDGLREVPGRSGGQEEPWFPRRKFRPMRRLSVVAFLLLCSGAAIARAVPHLSSRLIALHSAHKLVSWHVRLPVIQGTGNDEAVNELLASYFVPDQDELDHLEQSVQPETYQVDVTFAPTLVTPDLLSLRYVYVGGMTHSEVSPNADTGTHLRRGFTIDLQHARLVPLARLFKSDSDWKERLQQAIRQKAGVANPSSDIGYYLTSTDIVLVHVSADDPGDNAEVSVPYSTLTDVIAQSGPLATLLPPLSASSPSCAP